MKNLLIILVLLFSFIQPLSAKNQSAAVGMISNNCSYILEVIDEILPTTKNDTVKITDAIEASITGFLTGLNLYYSSISDEKMKDLWHDEFDHIYFSVIDYCEKNPDKDLMEASINYFITLPDYIE